MSEMQKQMQPKNSNSESAVSRSGLRGCAAARLLGIVCILYGGARGSERNFVSPVGVCFEKGVSRLLSILQGRIWMDPDFAARDWGLGFVIRAEI